MQWEAMAMDRCFAGSGTPIPLDGVPHNERSWQSVLLVGGSLRIGYRIYGRWIQLSGYQIEDNLASDGGIG